MVTGRKVSLDAADQGLNVVQVFYFVEPTPVNLSDVLVSECRAHLRSDLQLSIRHLRFLSPDRLTLYMLLS
jgi:hypothetical protein